MDAIVFIESNKSGSSREAIKAAESLGYYTILFTSKSKFYEIQRQEFPDVHEMVYIDKSNINDKSKMIERLRGLQQRGLELKIILSFMDQFVHLAAKLSNEICGTTIEADVLMAMEDKALTRKKLKHLPSSIYYTLFNPLHDDITEFVDKNKKHLPLIVKAPLSTGSKDVILVKSEFELHEALEKLGETYPKSELLIEEFIMGPQYLVEIFVENGEVIILGLMEQDVSQYERFIVTGYSLLTSSEQEIHDSLYPCIKTIIKTLDLTQGTAHLELRWHKDNWKLIEVNPRISGGAMNRMIEIGKGINVVEETIKLYMGEEINLKPKKDEYVFTYYLTTDIPGTLKKVTGKNRAKRCPGVQAVYIKPRKGMKMYPPSSMGHRYAYVITTGETKEQARKLAYEAAQQIKFHIEPN